MEKPKSGNVEGIFLRVGKNIKGDGSIESINNVGPAPINMIVGGSILGNTRIISKGSYQKKWYQKPWFIVGSVIFGLILGLISIIQ